MYKFDQYITQTEEYGIVEEIRHPVVLCSGLPGGKVNEIVVFQDNSVGQILSLNPNSVEILTFSSRSIRPGSRVTRTGEKLFVPVGDEMLGLVIDPLGEVLFGQLENPPVRKREIDVPPLKIDRRARITKQFHTGIAIVDTMIPLGKGQRELIVGDRKTGKTSFVLNVAQTISQNGNGDIVVYASIGKEKNETKRLKEYFEKGLQNKKIVIVAASADQSPSLIDLTPYSAMTLAEYFRDQGKNVTVILDDLTTHAKFYREMSLLGKRFPGRDSYPGDIFYKHARLLERAGNFKLIDNEVASITCLPIGETQDSTLTDYIISNLIGITDGHVLFDIESFNQGMRPAIDVFLSVTRVGKQTQTQLEREITRNLLKLLKVHKETLSYQHFGAELSPEIKKLLEKGNRVYKFFEQALNVSVPIEVQTFFLTLILEGHFLSRKFSNIVEYRTKFLELYGSNSELKTKINSAFGLKSYKDYAKWVETESKSILSLIGAPEA